jgi:hypothetical protein
VWRKTPSQLSSDSLQLCTARERGEAPHLTLQALGVDAERGGARALAVTGGGEASELLHYPPRRRVVVAPRGRGADKDEREEKEQQKARGPHGSLTLLVVGVCWVWVARDWRREI